MHTERLLCDLIALPSVNPAFLPPGHPHAGEHRVADYLLSCLARAGLDLDFQEVFPGRRNILARLTPKGRITRRLLLAPHLDTVAADEDQFCPQVRGGRVFGRGACDTKGSIASMVSAIERVAKGRRRPASTEILFAGLVDEEHAQMGSRTLARSGLKADLAIVGEPTSLKLVTAHKGDVWLRFTTRGRAAHGARPELGRNAVHAMAPIVDGLETEYARSLRRSARRHPLLGYASVNVGAIAGGNQPNIVPDACSIQVDRRTLPGETASGVIRELRAWLRRHRWAATIEDMKTGVCPPLETDPASPLVRQLMRAAGQRQPLGVHFFCDAAILGTAGIPSVVFGPGNIAQAHTAREWIARQSLAEAVNLLAGFLGDQP